MTNVSACPSHTNEWERAAAPLPGVACATLDASTSTPAVATAATIFLFIALSFLGCSALRCVQPVHHYSYCRASRTFRRAARRAGKIAAVTPASIAITANTTSGVIGTERPTPYWE